MQRMELFLLATDPKERRSQYQEAAISMHIAGQEGLDVSNRFFLSAEEAQNYGVLVRRFEAYCLPRCNETIERYVFRSRRQKEGEVFEHYGDRNASVLRDQIMYVTSSKELKLRERRMLKKYLTLEMSVECC